MGATCCKSECFVVSIHAPAKGATWRPDRILPGWCFNPRSREGSDPWKRWDTRKPGKFQSTLPRRERLHNRQIVNYYIKFQSTLPRRERHRALKETEEENAFQSTLPRRERHSYPDSVSSHSCFNPRSREGSDGDWQDVYNTFNVSIHAPAKGATMETHVIIKSIKSFNPRSREGSDHLLRFPQLKNIVSIHAPAKGATLEELPAEGGLYAVSIHAPAKGATWLF